jgi:2-oxoglutarate dehydrogenase E2 component (dihydrolipoamide succinyltransferase)
MVGGTFTISNGGVFGSLYGTPIINQPQAAILGMHAVKERPVVVNGKIEIRPMVCLSNLFMASLKLFYVSCFML